VSAHHDSTDWIRIRASVRTNAQLKYYGGRSIFSSLYESPAERKRASLTELFQAFPQAEMVMLGDSAEQDLELYVEFAKAYPGKVALIAIRDVTSGRAAEVWRSLERLSDGLMGSPDGSAATTKDEAEAEAVLGHVDPASSDNITGTSTQAAAAQPASAERHTTRPSRQGSVSSISSASLSSDEDIKSLTSAQQKILQRAATWETRKAVARAGVPKGTAVYFFKDPLEVEEPISKIIETHRV
jgi:hypothetical protein